LPAAPPRSAPATAATPAAAVVAEPPRRSTADDLKIAPRDPKASRASVERGRNALNRLSLQEAESAFNQALEADSTNANAIAGLSEVAFERSRYTEALDYARRALQASPRSWRYLVLVGDAYFKLFRYTDAKTAYDRALQLGAPIETVRSRLARVKSKVGQ
ncbi:MAG TPA: CDC27 family protein, partial [Polyangia bacterium]